MYAGNCGSCQVKSEGQRTLKNAGKVSTSMGLSRVGRLCLNTLYCCDSNHLISAQATLPLRHYFNCHDFQIDRWGYTKIYIKLFRDTSHMKYSSRPIPAITFFGAVVLAARAAYILYIHLLQQGKRYCNTTIIACFRAIASPGLQTNYLKL